MFKKMQGLTLLTLDINKSDSRMARKPKASNGCGTAAMMEIGKETNILA